MKILAAFTAVFVVLSVLGFTVYFHDENPWNGWFVPLWFGSLGGAVWSLSVVGIAGALNEIASGDVDRRRRERAAARQVSGQ